MLVSRIWNTVFGPKLMRSELRNEMVRILEEASKGGVEGKIVYFMGESRLGFEAIGVLVESGALKEDSSSQYNITLKGYDYHLELKAPCRYWVKKNWFPVAVLVFSSVVTVVTSLIVVHLG